MQSVSEKKKKKKEATGWP